MQQIFIINTLGTMDIHKKIVRVFGFNKNNRVT